MKKVMEQTLQINIRENQERYYENLKKLCKAKQELQNLNKEQTQQLKRLIAEKDQDTKTILNPQSTNNELETTIHSLEKSQISRKPYSARSTRENTNDNNLWNTKQLEFAPKKQRKIVPCLCYAFILQI